MNDAILHHMSDTGALKEAEQVMDRLDAGAESSPIVAPEDVRARLAKYCSTCGSCLHFVPHPSIHGEYGDCTLHHHVTTIDLSCESHIEGPNNPDPETQAVMNAIMAAQFARQVVERATPES